MEKAEKDMTGDGEFKKRLEELCADAYSRGRALYTDFLSQNEYSEFCEIRDYLEYASPKVFGGYEDAERVMIRFGDDSEDTLDFPISIIVIKQRASEKYRATLTHRDSLGAIMGLGIERRLIGDISVGDDAYVFVEKHIADYICSSLHEVGKAPVNASLADSAQIVVKREGKTVFVPSMRVDAIVGEVFSLSRSQSLEYFRKELVFVNGKICASASKQVEISDKISVRGKGKFEIIGPVSLTKKGRYSVLVSKYI